MFDLRSSPVYKALRYPFWVVVPLQIMFGVLATLFLLFYLFPKPHPLAGDFTQNETIGIFLICAAINIWCILYWLFYLVRLKRLLPPLSPAEAKAHIEKGGEMNGADFLDLEAAQVLYRAILFAKKHDIALSAIVVLFALLHTRRVEFIFSRLLVNKKEFEKGVEVIVNSQFKLKPNERMLGEEFSLILARALEAAADRSLPFITFGSIFGAVVEGDKTIQRLFFDFGVRKEDMAQVIMWEEAYYKEYVAPKSFLENFMRVKGLADDWVYGYTPTLNVYGREIAVRSIESEAHMHILARGEEIDEVETILARSGKNNVVLVSESGAGKTSV
ncbi:hypothetical protein HYR65_01955, partial [Candidatus Azambacteria bacterium]|nr:hypothetical protein [Candidatus Azambacteria bacterium]